MLHYKPIISRKPSLVNSLVSLIIKLNMLLQSHVNLNPQSNISCVHDNFKWRREPIDTIQNHAPLFNQNATVV